MIIIEMCGGLGNQMFQYALYTKLKMSGKEVKLDLSYFQEKNALRKFELDIFRIDYEIASDREICKYKKNGILNRLFGLKTNKKEYIENLDTGFQPIVLSFDDKYLQGYWQCEKYFKDIRNVLLDKFTFPFNDDNSRCKEILMQIQHTESVSLHVRRGDYLSEQNIKIYGNICTLSYYRNAITYIKQKIKNPVFFLFTNDADWVKEHILEEDMVIVDCNTGNRDYLDMFLMSQCRHNIIANSSFSWWGAWLNQNAEKIVMSPSRWFKNHETTDIICEGWVRLDNKGDQVINENSDYTMEQ